MEGWICEYAISLVGEAKELHNVSRYFYVAVCNHLICPVLSFSFNIKCRTMAKRDKISHHKPVKPRPQLNVFEAILCGFLWLSGLWRLFRIVAYCILLIHEVLCNFLIDTYLWTAKQIGRTAAHIVVSMWPLILSWANVLSLIFGGCCSNVRNHLH